MCKVSLVLLVMLSSANNRCRFASHVDCFCGVDSEIRSMINAH